MALPGETIRLGASPYCCGAKLPLKVLQSNAGFYIGTFCPQCFSPYSRESHYYPSWEEAQDALKNDTVKWREA